VKIERNGEASSFLAEGGPQPRALWRVPPAHPATASAWLPAKADRAGDGQALAAPDPVGERKGQDKKPMLPGVNKDG
jgi:hypothetical protein